MPAHKFELSDMSSDSTTNLTSSTGKSNRGLNISPALGLVLVLLAVVLAVLVGIIVHFAGGNRDVTCHCEPTVGTDKPSAEAIRQGCLELAAQGDVAVCEKCPGRSSTYSPGNQTSTYSPGNQTSTYSPGSQTNPCSPESQTTSSPATTQKPKVTDVRLPKAVKPLHYNVELQPYMHDPYPENFTFRGSVRILVNCVEATNNITLHVNVLKVNTSTIDFRPEVTGNSSDPRVSGHEIDEDRQFFIVKLDRDMEAGKNYILNMTFVSPLKNDLAGLYYSKYTRDNQTIYLATTQFQPTDARKAFPCFDEPAIKATFNITLVRPSDRISISNMPIESNVTFQENGIDYVKDIYRMTPKMSTYLLAFIICDFEYTYNYTNNSVLYRAWATPQSVNQTIYSLGVGIEIIEYFEDYFQVPYPLPKQDMIAIPDFAAGAMENWGLITYRETAMLYKDGVSNEANKERVAIVVSHELAHQWFGNLVTPSWWDDLWLNEGFASFVEYLGVDKVHPEWRMFEKFVISDLQNAFDFDGLTSSHPVYVPVGHPDEINEIFDTISYAKGASIIRMMRHFLGEETFRLGLTNYLNNLRYADAFHDDLWYYLTQQATADGKGHIDVKAIMDTWTLQMNFPVVNVSIINSTTGSLHVTQQRYLSDPTSTAIEKYTSRFGYRWTIPLTFTSSESPLFNQNDSDVYWMNRTDDYKSLNVSIPLPESNNSQGWILANVQQYGYYRVNYEENNWLALCNQLSKNHSVIPVINRAQIINDAWNLAKAGHVGLHIALETIDYLHLEQDYVPWYAARSELSFVESMLAFTSLYGSFQKIMISKLNNTYSRFGLVNVIDLHVEVATQSLISSQACYYGIQLCLEEASRLYRQWMGNPSHNPINPNLKTVIYCNAIANGGWDEWQFALERYNDADVASEKANLLYAMSCSKQPWILKHYMMTILQPDSPIRKQDALTVVSGVSRNNIGRLLAWNFFREKYSILKEQFGSSFFAWSGVIEAVTESFNTDFELQEISAFKESQSGNLGSGERAFEQAIEKVASNIKWIDQNIPIIADWLAKNNNN